MPGILLDGRIYEMRRNGSPFLARGGDGVGLTEVVRFEDGNGSDFCVTEKWFQKKFRKNDKLARIRIDTSKNPPKIRPLVPWYRKLPLAH